MLIVLASDNIICGETEEVSFQCTNSELLEFENTGFQTLQLQ